MQINGNATLVTIVTPSLNSAAYITDTIESVLGQTYPNVEHVIIDGGSTDGTLDILKSYGDRIRWVTGKDSGTSEAISKGILMARGQYVSLLGSDDFYEPDAVEAVLTAFAESPDAGVVHGAMRRLYPDGTARVFMPVKDAGRMIWRMNPYNSIAAFVRRELYDKYGLWDMSVKIANDYEVWMRFTENGVKFKALDRVITNMRVGGMSEASTLATLKDIRDISIRHGYPQTLAYANYWYKFAESKAGSLLRRLGLGWLANIYRGLFYPHAPRQ